MGAGAPDEVVVRNDLWQQPACGLQCGAHDLGLMYASGMHGIGEAWNLCEGIRAHCRLAALPRGRHSVLDVLRRHRTSVVSSFCCDVTLPLVRRPAAAADSPVLTASHSGGF